MERAPPTEFGRALRRLIREVWGSQSAFALAAFVDESWIAKLIRCPEPRLSRASLERLLVCLPRPSHREELYAAWLATCAPSPLDIDWRDLDALGALRLASEVHDRISSGRVVETRTALLGLWERFGPSRGDLATAFAVGEPLIDCSNQLDRVACSLRVCAELDSACSPSEEPLRTAKALWLRGVSTRLLRPRRAVEAAGALDLASEFALSLKSAGCPGLPELKAAMERDQTLALLDLYRAGNVEPGKLARRAERLQGISERLDASEAGLAKEVRARVLVALGRYDEAETDLCEAHAMVSGAANLLKIEICRMELFWETGEREDAERTFDTLLNRADTLALAHHRAKLSSLGRRYGLL